MAIFEIPVEWSVFAMVKIEAETLEDAVKVFDETIDDIPLPVWPEYIDGSFKRCTQDDETETLEYYKSFN